MQLTTERNTYSNKETLADMTKLPTKAAVTERKYSRRY